MGFNQALHTHWANLLGKSSKCAEPVSSFVQGDNMY